ncbi:XdhC family protein [Halocynthiibacter namhaensis]|uniref:XdhC family protein n=1 Tax=Halocynthiibacter namhaensis TaxID=1290553 RepID=UPI0005797394|nr:XdhC family protein [Halocynthiibacter namhaensis]
MNTSQDIDQIPEAALAFLNAGEGVALATVVDTWGSAPRPVGSQLAISSSGDMVGSVSGGCVEGAVILEAQDAILDGKHRVLTFGVSDENAFEVGLACGGQIRVIVEPVINDGPGLTPDKLRALVTARAGRRSVGSEIDLTHGAHQIVHEASPATVSLWNAGKSGALGDRFLALHLPPLRLIVTGAVHIAQHLVPMAEAAGFDVTLIDPRPVFGSEARFAGRMIVDDWPDEAMEVLQPDARTGLVTLTHDAKLDDPAIEAALRRDVFYIGCLGSKRTHAKRVQRLQESGFTADDIARIHGPVGLNIGAKSPAEIAISVMAEVIQVLRVSNNDAKGVLL